MTSAAALALRRQGQGQDPTTLSTLSDIQQWPYRAMASAFEVIPRTLAQNCGGDVVRLITALRAKHAAGGNETWGIDGEKGVLADMKDVGVWEPYLVKTQTIKTAIESAQMLLRIDAVVSGVARKG